MQYAHLHAAHWMYGFSFNLAIISCAWCIHCTPWHDNKMIPYWPQTRNTQLSQCTKRFCRVSCTVCDDRNIFHRCASFPFYSRLFDLFLSFSSVYPSAVAIHPIECDRYVSWGSDAFDTWMFRLGVNEALMKCVDHFQNSNVNERNSTSE